jgi:hypothetical protein
MQTHRFIWQIIRDIAALPDETQKVIALLKSPPAIRSILHFVYGNHTFALPEGQIDLDPIPTKAWLDRDAGGPGDDDLLALEASRMSRIFTVEGNPNLVPKRRREIWMDILERASPEERDLLETISFERVVPGIPRRVAVRAFPEIDDDVVPSAPAVAEPYEQNFMQWRDLVDQPTYAPPSQVAPPPDSDFLVDRPQPQSIAPLFPDTHVPTWLGPPAEAREYMDAVDCQPAPTPAPQAEPTRNEGLYARLMKTMGWDRL